MEVGSFTYAIFMATCVLFTLFNVISGRLFLGDSGAYNYSLVALNGLFLHSAGVFSAAFLAVLFAYPCIDILSQSHEGELQEGLSFCRTMTTYITEYTSIFKAGLDQKH